MTREEAGEIVELAAIKLGEHFAAVQIMVSYPADGGGTWSTKRGCGDWYARIGLAHEFIAQDQAETQANELSSKINPPDEDKNWKL
jgi:hypothetical protein